MHESMRRAKSPNMAAGAQYSQQNLPESPLSVRYGSIIATAADSSMPMINARFLIDATPLYEKEWFWLFNILFSRLFCQILK
jgi:hypothetical protein